jgi:OFA family oxalate/formate antiporter-like MFS transporter
LKLPRIYYGWWIIIACFISSLYVAGVVVFGFSAFFEPFIQEFGWSYAQVSLAVSIRGAETGLIAPLLGFLVDRWGSRWLMFSGALLVGISLIILSKMQSMFGFYTGAIILAIGSSFSSPAVVTPSASNWFKKRLGISTGLLAAGFGFGGLLVPVIVKLIAAQGWRDALFIMGIGTFVICLPLALVIRHKPEDYGYAVDGEPLSKLAVASVKDTPVENSRPAEVEISTKQAVTSRAFWILTVAFTLQYIVVGAVLAHIIPFLTSVEINRATAGFLAAGIPVISILGRLSAGVAGDKVSRKQLTILSFIIIGIGTFLFDLSSINSLWLAVLAIFLFGLAYGSANTLRALLLRQYFGRSRFGTLFGFFLGALSLGVILGPYLAGWIFDAQHSYHYAWWIFTAMNIIALLLIIILSENGLKKPAKDGRLRGKVFSG